MNWPVIRSYLQKQKISQKGPQYKAQFQMMWWYEVLNDYNASQQQEQGILILQQRFKYQLSQIQFNDILERYQLRVSFTNMG